MLTQTLKDRTESFPVSLHLASTNSPVVLFAAGAGGLPERYATLLRSLIASDYTVIAPHFERLASLVPDEEGLIARARRLSLALDSFALSSTRVIGVGHSIGAAILIAMAGGDMWLKSGIRVDIKKDERLARLALLAPPTGFFRAPNALNVVKLPLLVWVGSEDTVTPPTQTEWFAQTIRDWNIADVHITEGAGHFSFMDNPPPQTIEPLADKRAFLQEYSDEICNFVML